MLRLRPALGLRRGAGDRRADRDPVPRRPRGRGRDAAAGVAPAAAQARARRCRSRRGSSRVAAHALTDLTWTQAFLLGALLSPTDPVLSSSVVTNPRVPRVVRHSLNLESGLNDGLALPPVLALTAALAADSDFVWWTLRAAGRRRSASSTASSSAAGVARAAARPRPSGDPRPPAGALRARRRVPHLRRRRRCRRTATASSPCSCARSRSASAARTSAQYFEARSEDIIEIVKLGVFVVFGSLLTLDGLFVDGWAAVAIVVVTLLVARTGRGLGRARRARGSTRATKAFMAWFGPKGVATMTFSLLVLGEAIPAASGSSTSPRSSWSARSSRTG